MARNRYNKRQRKQNQREVRKPKQNAAAIVKSDAAIIARATTKTYVTPSCNHWRQPFRLNGGLVIHASAWSDEPRDVALITPIDIGFYLDAFWAADEVLTNAPTDMPIPNRGAAGVKIMWPWKDGSQPSESTRAFIQACTWLLSQLVQGKSVDTGCFASHGRTGTMLASLLVMQGVRFDEAIARVRSTHCTKGVETADQVRFLRDLDETVNHVDHTLTPLPKGTHEWPTTTFTSSKYKPGGTPSAPAWSGGWATSSPSTGHQTNPFADAAERLQDDWDAHAERLRFLDRIEAADDTELGMRWNSAWSAEWEDLDPDEDCVDGANACIDRYGCGTEGDCLRSALLTEQLGGRL